MGHPAIKEQYDYMKSYSPYDTSRPGHTRISCHGGAQRHARDVLRARQVGGELRAVKTDDNVLLLKPTWRPGTAGLGRYDALRKKAFEYAFSSTDWAWALIRRDPEPAAGYREVRLLMHALAGGTFVRGDYRPTVTAAYFGAQGTLVATWWVLLLAHPPSRLLFKPPGSSDDALLAFWLPDLALAGAGSIVAAVLCWRRSPRAGGALWLVAGAVSYAALYCVRALARDRRAQLGAVLDGARGGAQPHLRRFGSRRARV